MARLYETVVLVDANQEDAAIEATFKKFNDLLVGGAEVIRVDRWGKRRIAYEIQGRSHADYTVYYYNAPRPQFIAEFERMLRLDETVLRFMTVVDNPCGLPPVNQEAVEAVAIPEDISDEKED